MPSFMIPAAFIAIDQIPLTSAARQGLRRALPYPATASADGLAGGYTPIQIGMSHLWSRLLKTGQVSLDDDFFQLGGNSLLAAEMLARVRVMFGIGANYVRPLTRCL